MPLHRWGLLASIVLPASACMPGLEQTAASGGAISVGGLTAEHKSNPLGLDDEQPRLGWIVRASVNDVRQTAYQLRVSRAADGSGEIWRSPRVDSAQSFDVAYAGPPLASRTRYYWSVQSWTNRGATGWSAPAWFETSFIDPGGFQGAWIGRTATRAASQTPEPLLRRDFTLSASPVVSARLYIAGLGLYKAYINDARVGTAEVDPAYTPYDRSVLYATYDVTALLRAGSANAIGVRLGRGYYAAFKDQDTDDAPWLSERKLKLQLDVRHADGSIQTVLSDGIWRTADGPTLTDSVKYGETYDARREQPGWASPGFDASTWQPAVPVTPPAGVLRAEPMEPIRVLADLPAPVATRISPTTTLYDFTVTRAGWARIRLHGRAGDVVHITYGEKLNAAGAPYVGGEGPFGGVPVQSYAYTLRGDPAGESFTPSYSYDGFRFVQVVAPATTTVDEVRGQLVSTDVPVTGHFTSSDPLLNRYHDAMVHSLLANMHGLPTDTPMYEKRGWTADAMLMADSALINLGSESFWENWMLDHRDNQAADGGFAQIVPNENPGGKQEDPFVGSTADPIWSASYVEVNHALYRQRGDLRTVERNYDGMMRWMRKWIATLDGTGDVFTGKSWGDHEPAYGSGTDNRIVTSLVLVRAARDLAEMARASGHAADAPALDAFAARVSAAVNAAYYDQASHSYRYTYVTPAPPPGMGAPPPPAMLKRMLPPGMDHALTPAEMQARQYQTYNVMPIALGIVPHGDHDAACAALLADVRTTSANHVTTGAVVLKDVLPTLTACGGADIAYRAATNPSYPGWGYWFLTLDGSKGEGGETIHVDTHWEAWGPGARSHDHAFRGTVDDWLFADIAGLRATSPGYRSIAFAPHVVGGMRAASADVASPLGRVATQWQNGPGGFSMTVQVPVGATGEVTLPGGGTHVTVPPGAIAQSATDGRTSYRVPSGTYRFTSD